MSRKGELRRLAAKRGWWDGHRGNEPDPPVKAVMTPRGGLGFNSVPPDEENAYWNGYEEGGIAKAAGIGSDQNPYCQAR